MLYLLHYTSRNLHVTEITMNTKTTIVILLILLIAVGWFSYSKGVQRGMKAAATANALVGNVPGANNAWVPSASFACKDGTHFIAEFPNAAQLRVVVDGNIARVLSRVNGLGQRFEDSTCAYVFAGEEATVTNKGTKKTTTCEQPMDPNNAPMNFGDAGEGTGANAGNGTGVQPDVTLIVQQNIVGTWKSTQDAKFTREFTSAGAVIDYYENKEVTKGTWQIFNEAKPLKVSFPLEKTALYVQMTTAEDPNGTLNFKLIKLTPESLELVYMERGGTNTFTRIK